jgi:hypothetical protein
MVGQTTPLFRGPTATTDTEAEVNGAAAAAAKEKEEEENAEAAAMALEVHETVRGGPSSDDDGLSDGLVVRSTPLFKTVLAVPYYERKLFKLNNQVAEMQKEIHTLSAEVETNPAKKFVSDLYSTSGLVTFKSKRAANTAIQVVTGLRLGNLRLTI